MVHHGWIAKGFNVIMMGCEKPEARSPADGTVDGRPRKASASYSGQARERRQGLSEVLVQFGGVREVWRATT